MPARKPHVTAPKSGLPKPNPVNRLGQSGKPDSIGGRIAAALNDRDRTWLAQATGIPASTLHDYIRGAMPSADRAFAIARALNVDINWLIGGEPIDVSQDGSERLRVPYYTSTLVSGGERPGDHLAVPRRWIETIFGPVWQPFLTHLPPHRVRAIPAPGAIVLCEAVCEVPLSEGSVHLLHLPEGVAVRRLASEGGVIIAIDDAGSATPMAPLGSSSPPRLIARVLGSLFRPL